MKKVVVLLVVGLTCCVPAWALIDCWEGKSVASLATESEIVVIGVITSIEPLGCRLEDGSIGACPAITGLGRFPDRASKLTFAVRKVLKGNVVEPLEFVVFWPELLVVCKGPGMELYTHSLAFLHRDGHNLVAWGGDYSIYQRTRTDLVLL